MGRNNVDRGEEQAEVQLVRIADRQVTQAEIETSGLFNHLMNLGLPVEISRVMGLHDIMTADAMRRMAMQQVIALEWAKAEMRVEIFKAERRAKGMAEDAIALAAAEFSNTIRPAVVIRGPSAPPSLGTVNVTLAPGGSQPPLTPRQAIGLNGNGQGVAGDPNQGIEAIGIIQSISGGQAVVAVPGDVVGGFSGLVPGRLYYPGPGGALQLQANGTLPVGRAIDPATMQVLDPSQPCEVVTALGAITAGAPVYWDPTTGKYAMCNNAAAIQADVAGVALDTAVAGGTFRLAPPGSRLNPALLGLPSTITGPYAYVGATSGAYGNAPAPGLGLFARPVVRLYSNPASVVAPGTTVQNWLSAQVLDRAPVQV